MTKNTNIIIGFSAIVLSAVASSAFAAGVMLTNGGLGQVATNPQSFGIAICNGGTQAVNQSVPVSVVSNGATVSATSAGSIAAGQCTYTYINYAQFNMTAGQSYSISVTIDPNHTVATNANNQASYTVTVPGRPVAVATTQSNNDFLAVIGGAFTNFFAAIKKLF